MQIFKSNKSLIALALAAACGSALADRPMVVDDATIADVGTGNVKLWLTKVDSFNSTSVAGAFAPWKTVEIGAGASSGDGLKTSNLLAKWLITPSQQSGCNFAASLGWTRVSLSGFGSSNGTSLLGAMSCNGAAGTAHFNLGYTKPSGASGSGSWGVAFERPFGAVTPNIEVFGAEDVDTTVQVGLRGNIAKNVQLDGSIGRVDSLTIYTMGVRFQF